MIAVLLLLHALAGTIGLLAAKRIGRSGLLLAAVPPLLTTIWAATQAGAVLDGRPRVAHVTWVDGLGLGVDVRLDAFALLMVVLVSGIGTLVFAYAWHYFGGSEKAGRAAGLLVLFSGAMLGVVTADNLLWLYVCWELTSITSYLLIGLDDAEPDARASALHALLVTGLGGLVMLGGFVLLGEQAGTYRISELLDAAPTGTTVAVALALVLVGALTKSAQYPFHSWLPAAMVAPTPISAYLHSAAMVKAGVYLVARLAPAFAHVGLWRPAVLGLGLLTMVAGGLRATRRSDLKQLLAFGTISQLGFLMVLFGAGHPAATAAGCAVLLAHGFFKAALFMVVGVVDHETSTRDIGRLPVLDRGWTTARVVALVSAGSMAAVPPLAGFLAKEEAYAAFVDGTGWDRVVLAGLVVGSVCTVAYSARFAVALVDPERLVRSERPRPVHSHGPRRGFVAPIVVLAVASATAGVAPFLWSPLVDEASLALDAGAGTHLHLWHGFNVPLLLSAVTLAAGAAMFVARAPIERGMARLAPTRDGVDAYEGIVRGVVRGAARVTAVAQPGSLPVYAAVILTTAALAPTIALLGGAAWSGWPALVGRPAHLPIAALLIVASTAATLARRRFAAALLLGATGYAMAILFVIQGAPDLALTQFAIETLSVVAFLLVLRRLPDRFERQRTGLGPVPRLLVSGAVGVFVAVLALASAGARTAPPVSATMPDQAYAEGEGRNVVNVILVDIRGMDTVGEVTVLVVAAVGIVALARAGRTPRPRSSRSPIAPTETAR